MNEIEFHKYIRLFIVILFLLAFYLTTIEHVDEYNAKKGIAISNYLDVYQGLNVPPDQAQYFNIDMNQWDISIQDLDVFGSWENGKGKKGRW